MTQSKTSQLSQFYKRTLEERRGIIVEWLGAALADNTAFDSGLTAEIADSMIENALGTYNLPFGVATNFLINDRDYLIPMVIEEPSVVAAVSFAAKLFREGGGFITRSDDPIMIGQIQLLDFEDATAVLHILTENRAALLEKANAVASSLHKRGGGARDLEYRLIESAQTGVMIVLHLLYDTRDAMGANAVNTAVEALAPTVE
ncbi:hypothetical protein HC928_26300 [bacterium]|nr:hypothetical protein [bacterium]